MQAKPDFYLTLFFVADHLFRFQDLLQSLFLDQLVLQYDIINSLAGSQRFGSYRGVSYPR